MENSLKLNSETYVKFLNWTGNNLTLSAVLTLIHGMKIHIELD